LSNVRGMDRLQRRIRALGDAPAETLKRAQILAVRYGKEEAPVKTRALQRTVRPGVLTERTAEILAGGQQRVGYAGAVHQGSVPHIIRPRRKKALAFPAPKVTGKTRLTGSLRMGVQRGLRSSDPQAQAAARSGLVVVRWVRHPGTKPNPFLVRGARRAIHEVGLRAVVDAWNGAA
jgi:hypothetical protein